MNDKNVHTYSNFILQLILLIIFLFGSAFLVLYIFRAFVWAIFFAFLLYATFDKYNKRLLFYIKNKDLTSLIIIVMIIVLVIGPLIFFISILIQQIINLVKLIQMSIENGEMLRFFLNFDALINFITNDPFFWVTFLNRLGEILKDYSEYLNFFNVSGLVGGAYNIFMFSLGLTIRLIVYILLGFVLLFFLLRDGHTFYIKFSQMLPFDQTLMDDFKNQMKLVISAILKGNVFIAILQGLFLAIGFYIAGIPNIVLYGFLGALFSIIPVLGTSIVWLPASLYLYFIKHSLGWSIFLSVYCLLSFFTLENIVKPKILDKQIGIPSILLFLAIIGGLKEFGISGLILGPLILALFIIVWRLYPYADKENILDKPIQHSSD
ncbi:MAG: AI-2E family transporter [Leptospiraceae bacterium]|nr:MAG: AI-2E family transporter [Leptospiraceae bacterium]